MRSPPRIPLPEWVAVCALAEGLGIATVSVTYAAVDRGMITAAAPMILLAGAWEGLCLGSTQAFFLRRLGISPGLWVLLTVTGAIVGYGLSLMGGAGSGDPGTGNEPPLWIMALLGAGAGLGMGVAMGLIQMPALRGRLSAAGWIAANAIGWMPAMAVIMAAAGLAERHWSLVQVAAAGGLSGAVAGFCVGVATATVLARAA